MEIDVLVGLEHRGWAALCDGTGAGFYGELMTPEGVMVLAPGMVLDRRAVIASLDDAPTWDSYEILDERLIPIADDTAALVYRARAQRVGEATFEALMTSVYTRSAGEWRLALYQQTPVATQ